MNHASRRVAITGLGMINSLGTSVPECWDAMLHGKSGIRPIRRFKVSDCETKIGGELTEAYYELEKQEFSTRKMKQTASTTRLGYLCAREAMVDSGFPVGSLDPYRCASITGCGQTGNDETETDEELIRTYRQPSKFVIIQQMPNALSGWVSIEYGLKGRSYNVSTACASGAFAVANAFEYIAGGHGDMAVVVGVDTLLTSMSIKGFNALMAMSTRNDDPQRAMRPFDKDRDGFVLANGGAALVLEREELARRRDARIYAFLSGASMLSEAFNIVAPQPSGEEMAQTMRFAVKCSGHALEDVGYVSAHGTSTQQNDADESAAIGLAFGEHAKKLAVSSQKSMTGHSVGGAGAIECATCALILHHGVITPTMNLVTPDSHCQLDYVPNEPRQARNLKVAISNSFGFGGHNSTLVLEKA